MRKWNKLLALMLAMAMVLGMATTAFAAEDDAATADGGETPVEETNEDVAVDETTPAEGEETAPVEETPAEETPAEAGYTDVTEANWFYEAVTYVTENGLVDGETETTFAPSADMTRADMIVALYRMAGSPEVTGGNPFTDVAADADYYAAVIWGTSNGVINGTSETTFSPDDSLQRQAFATMLYRYAELMAADETTDETAPAEEVPAEGETTDETTPADDAAAADEAAPADDAAAADETAPADDAAAADETAPADDAAAADETVPAEELTPAEEVPAEGETTDETAPAEGETAEEVPAEGETTDETTPAEGETTDETAPMEELTPAEEVPAEETGAEDVLAQFTDADQIQDYAREAMAWAVTVGLFEGNADGALNPRGNATRAEVATLIMRFAEMTAAEEAPEDAIGGADEATDITVTDGEETTETETPAEGEETTETETPAEGEATDETTDETASAEA